MFVLACPDYLFGGVVELFGTVTGATTQGVGLVLVFIAVALLVEVALLVVIGAVLLDVEPLAEEEFADAGTLLDGVVELAAAAGAAIIPEGHGDVTLVFVVVVLLVPGVATAPAGTFALGFVVDCAPAGVAPGVVVLPFC